MVLFDPNKIVWICAAKKHTLFKLSPTLKNRFFINRFLLASKVSDEAYFSVR